MGSLAGASVLMGTPASRERRASRARGGGGRPRRPSVSRGRERARRGRPPRGSARRSPTVIADPSGLRARPSWTRTKDRTIRWAHRHSKVPRCGGFGRIEPIARTGVGPQADGPQPIAPKGINVSRRLSVVTDRIESQLLATTSITLTGCNAVLACSSFRTRTQNMRLLIVTGVEASALPPTGQDCRNRHPS